jgi:hypothetical protein
MHDDGSRDHVDQMIDEIARTMTAGRPSPALRSGVRSRIDGPIHGWSPVSWRAAVGVATLAVIAVAAVLMIQPRAPVVPGAAENRRDIALHARSRVDVEQGGDTADPQASQEGLFPSAPAARAVAQGTTLLQNAPQDEPPALPFPALSVERVAIEPLAPEPVTLDEFTGPVPLSVQRLDITALSLE